MSILPDPRIVDLGSRRSNREEPKSERVSVQLDAQSPSCAETRERDDDAPRRSVVAAAGTRAIIVELEGGGEFADCGEMIWTDTRSWTVRRRARDGRM